MKRHLAQALYWFLFATATGFLFGLAQYLGQDTARALVIRLVEAVHR